MIKGSDYYNEVQNGLNKMLEAAWKETDLSEEIKLAMLHALTNGSSHILVRYAADRGMSFEFCPNSDRLNSKD